jgi:hypothetical protein
MHVIKRRNPIIMGNQGCSPVIKGNNTLLYLAHVSILNRENLEFCITLQSVKVMNYEFA